MFMNHNMHFEETRRYINGLYNAINDQAKLLARDRQISVNSCGMIDPMTMPELDTYIYKFAEQMDLAHMNSLRQRDWFCTHSSDEWEELEHQQFSCDIVNVGQIFSLQSVREDNNKLDLGRCEIINKINDMKGNEEFVDLILVDKNRWEFKPSDFSFLPSRIATIIVPASLVSGARYGTRIKNVRLPGYKRVDDMFIDKLVVAHFDLTFRILTEEDKSPELKAVELFHEMVSYHLGR